MSDELYVTSIIEFINLPWLPTQHIPVPVPIAFRSLLPMRVLDMGWDLPISSWLGPRHSCPRFKRVSAWTPCVADGGIGVEVWNLIWCLAISGDFVLIVKARSDWEDLGTAKEAGVDCKPALKRKEQSIIVVDNNG